MLLKVSGSIGLYFRLSRLFLLYSSFTKAHCFFTYSLMPASMVSEIAPKYFWGWNKFNRGSPARLRATVLLKLGSSFLSYFAMRFVSLLWAGTASELTLLMMCWPWEIKLLKFCSRNSNLSRYFVLITSVPSSPYMN